MRRAMSMITNSAELQFRYLRAVRSLDARVPLLLSNSSTIRLFDSNEAAKLIDTMRRRNVIARLSGPNNFYLVRAAELSNRTVIEVFGAASPDHMLAVGDQTARLIEKLTLLSTTLVTTRSDFLRRLGISDTVIDEVDLAVTGQFKSMRSRSKRAPSVDGILVDKAFCSRFRKCGFLELFTYCQTQSNLSERVCASTDWLLESRREARLTASVVKTAIALESLLIFSESESLARTLSERAAFMLSQAPDVRQEISRIFLRFYDVRSGIVHGSRKKAQKLTSSLTECVDRLTLMLHLVIASNRDLWPNVESLRLWCEDQRWSKSSSNIRFPLSGTYMKNALTLAAKAA